MDTPAQRLHRRTGHLLDACKRAVHRAYDDGLLDAGVSDSRYVLTAAGTALLASTRAVQEDTYLELLHRSDFEDKADTAVRSRLTAGWS